MQAISDIVELLYLKGLKFCILSPGSRSAPLTLAFAKHAGIKKYIIPDERAAAYIALGIAEASSAPVALLCTSGTAVLNYYPAVAEAFYSQIPLLVLTADRPTEWVDQADGQTIRQQNVFANHIKAQFQLLPDRENADSKWLINRVINDAFNAAAAYPYAPVHVNVPLREPLYAHTWEGFSSEIRVIREIDSQKTLSETFWEKFTEEWNKTEQKMLLIGRGNFEGKISRFCQKMNFVKIADAPANLKDENCIKNHDIFLSEKRHDLRPEILITFGGDVLSKKLKNFIRKNPPRAHYHLAPAGAVPDTFGTLTDILRVEPEYFFGQLFKRQACSLSNTFQKKWKDEDENAAVKKATIFGEKKWSEWGAMNEIFKNIPENVHLHLGNSMPVRYANVFDWAKKNIKIWSNRGTSGIDGCASTAVGHALLDSDKLHFLFIGDVSFFYDRNAFWHNDLPKNLKIIVFNNFGGGIFKMIDGPKNWQECDEFFVTHQSKTAQKTAEDYHFDYFSGENFEEMSVAFQNLLASKKTALMEIFTDKSQNSAVYDKIMKN